jgi:hypothetical protein
VLARRGAFATLEDEVDGRLAVKFDCKELYSQAEEFGEGRVRTEKKK